MRSHSPVQFMILTLAVIMCGAHTCIGQARIVNAIDRAAERCKP